MERINVKADEYKNNIYLYFISHLFQDKMTTLLVDTKITNISYNLILRIQIINFYYILFFYQAFRNCIKNITAVDNTLEKLGITTDYKLHMRTIWLILGWCSIIILILSLDIPFLRSLNFNIAQSIYIPFKRMYYIHINVINDLTITSMLWLVYCYI